MDFLEFGQDHAVELVAEYEKASMISVQSLEMPPKPKNIHDQA